MSVGGGLASPISADSDFELVAPPLVVAPRRWSGPRAFGRIAIAACPVASSGRRGGIVHRYF